MSEDYSLTVRPPSAFQRAVSATSAFVRTTLASMGVARVAPSRPGASYYTVASARRAEADLQQIAQSPAVYAAIQRRGETFANAPVRVYEGYGMGDVKSEPLDPDKHAFVAAFLRLLEKPNPADLDVLFPSVPGELMIAQLVADALLTGTAYLIPTRGTGDQIVGLTRAHPQTMALIDGGLRWRHTINGRAVDYDRGSVCCMRLVSWQSDGRGELGTGAGGVLEAIVRAEVTAMSQTATIIEHGGANVVVTGSTPVGVAMMSNAANRNAVAREVGEALKAKDGTNVVALGGEIQVDPIGLTPADIAAPALQVAAKAAELMTLGCVPVAAGAEASTYASAVLQYRVQSAIDEGLATVFEGHLFRPLIQQFARRAGYPGWMRLTARFDLSQHPGATFLRTEALARMEAWRRLGYSTDQAASNEGMSVPPPAEVARLNAAPPPAPPPTPAGSGAPPNAVGEGRTMASLFPGPIPRASSDGDPREAAWAAREARRETHDRALDDAASVHLASERAGYVARALEALQAAATNGDRRDFSGKTTYGPIDLSSILGDLIAARDRWVQSLADPWADSWDAGAADAFLGSVAGEGVDLGSIPMVGFRPGDYDPLVTSAGYMADYDQTAVSRLVTDGVDQGLSPTAIAAQLQNLENWSPVRANAVARTESVTSQESGTLRRYQRAAAMGLDVKREWMSDVSAVIWKRHHELMNGQTVGVGEAFIYPSGATGMGPGLTDVVGERVNCRCATRAVVANRAP